MNIPTQSGGSVLGLLPELSEDIYFVRGRGMS